MRPPQPRSLPWTPAEARALIQQSRFSWREASVLEALVEQSKPGGRVYLGNRRLAEAVSRVGPAVAVVMGVNPKRFPVIDRAYLGRILLRFRRFGIVDHWWQPVGPNGHYNRVLRVRIEGLEACAAWGRARDRRWDSSRDPKPADAPYPRTLNFPARRRSNRVKGGEFKHRSERWRQHYGPEWEFPE